ncbi:MAG: aminoglycoside phosphotransferase family protein [Pseudodonghicola sp.]|nr:aminoglycoside phosphotransferase family protein [Pseudodonghicola sp.]
MITHLHQRGFVAADPRPLPLAGGRTNRVWRLQGQLYDLVLKLYVSDAATPLFANDPRHEMSCLSALSDSGIAPTPEAADPQAQTPWILYRHLPGTGWTTGVKSVADLLGRVHAQTAPSRLPHAPDGSAELARQTLEILSLCHPSQTHALRALEPAGTVAPSGQRRLVHGDPVPGNIVMQGPRATLIDWQCPACGDPAGDLAIFTSPAMQLVYRGAPLSTGEKDAFLRAYPDRATVGRVLELQPWYHWRMAAYCLYQAERGRAGYAQGLALERAALSGQSSAR